MARLLNEEELLEFYETNLQLARQCRANNEHTKADTFDTLNYHIGRDLYRFNIELEYSADAWKKYKKYHDIKLPPRRHSRVSNVPPKKTALNL